MCLGVCGVAGSWAAWTVSILGTEKPGFEMSLAPALYDPRESQKSVGVEGMAPSSP